MTSKKNRTLLSTLLVVAAIALLWPIYSAPVWWVSLEAPDPPAESFPDGVRILFHFNGVFSGSRIAGQRRDRVEEALDWTDEMDTINHYVGMYPIASGGPLEVFLPSCSPSWRWCWRAGLVRSRTLANGRRWGSASPASRAGGRWRTMARRPALAQQQLPRGADHGTGQRPARKRPARRRRRPGEALIAALKASLAESAARDAGMSERKSTRGDADAARTRAARRRRSRRNLAYLRKAFEQDRNRRARPTRPGTAAAPSCWPGTTRRASAGTSATRRCSRRWSAAWRAPGTSCSAASWRRWSCCWSSVAGWAAWSTS